MMRSLFSGVAGLKTHQTKMDVIGNNIANVNTTAFKSQSITFQDLLYQTTQSASGANATTGTGGTNARQIGLGAKTGAISTAITTQGSAQSTSNPFDIMITGDNFFVVSNGSQNFFTRDGSFCVDGVGNLVMSSTGYTVMGWQSDADGNIIQDTVSPLKIMSAENMTYPPEATTLSYASGIVDKNDTNVNSTTGKVMSLSFYDNLGYQYNARFSIHAVDGDKGEYYVTLDNILDSDGNVYQGATATINGDPLTVNPKTTISRSNTNMKSTTDPATGTTTQEYSLVQYTAIIGTNTSPTTQYGIFKTTDLVNGSVPVDPTTKKATATDLSLNADGTSKGAADLWQYYSDSNHTSYGATVTGTFDKESGTMNINYSKTLEGGSVKLNFDPTTGEFNGIGTGDINKSNSTIQLKFSAGTLDAGNFETITMDWSNVTMYNNNGTSTVSSTSGDQNGLGTGRKLGEMSGVSISKDGIITATYDNGQNKILGQIVTASFANAAGLEKSGDNLYSATANSGEFDGIGVDITAGGGYMTTGVLEMSNVDLAAQFTDMITTQRGFQANSRIITVSDTLLEELTNLKR